MDAALDFLIRVFDFIIGFIKKRIAKNQPVAKRLRHAVDLLRKDTFHAENFSDTRIAEALGIPKTGEFQKMLNGEE